GPAALGEEDVGGRRLGIVGLGLRERLGRVGGALRLDEQPRPAQCRGAGGVGLGGAREDGLIGPQRRPGPLEWFPRAGQGGGGARARAASGAWGSSGVSFRSSSNAEAAS